MQLALFNKLNVQGDCHCVDHEHAASDDIVRQFRYYLVTAEAPEIALRFVASLGSLLALITITTIPTLGSAQSFSVPDDLALRIRLDDTLTSTDSQVGDPFSATAVDQGEYQNARVYGHVAQIDISGRIKGHTSMILRFDRLVMPDGRRVPIHAEIVELYYAPSGEKVDVEGAIESGGRRRKSIVHTASGAGVGPLLGGIFHGRQKITLNGGLEILIRTVPR